MMNDKLNLTTIVKSITDDIKSRLDDFGMFYRIFSRGKTVSSIRHKLSIKGSTYNESKKMQDIIGVRVVLYFAEDVDIVYNYLKTLPNYLDESNSSKEIKELEANDSEFKKRIGLLYDKLFMPQRLNLIFRMSSQDTECLKMALAGFEGSSCIDNTFEVQIRTIFSEGWHEVEHDLRYKCLKDEMWDYCKEESRMLNGIYASLETTENSMKSMFDNMAYKNFKHNDWGAMLRNKFCIRFEDNKLSDSVFKLLSSKDCLLGKEIFKYERSELFPLFKRLPHRIPRTMDNIVFLLNRVTIQDEKISTLEPMPIADLLNAINQ